MNEWFQHCNGQDTVPYLQFRQVEFSRWGEETCGPERVYVRFVTLSKSPILKSLVRVEHLFKGKLRRKCRGERHENVVAVAAAKHNSQISPAIVQQQRVDDDDDIAHFCNWQHKFLVNPAFEEPPIQPLNTNP